MNRKTRKRGVSALLAGVMVLALALSGCGQKAADPSDTDNNQADNVVEYEVGSAEAAAKLMTDLNGTYEELFPVILDAKYDEVWLDTAAACVGEENAQASVDMLKSSMSGTVIGQEAMDAYAGDPDGAKFNCDFTGGVDTFQFADSTITGFDTAGREVFSYTYSFVGYDETWDFYEYKTEDADAGEFTYFVMRSDTPEATYHIEFRYGSDLDALIDFYEGDYAYWMPAGILTNADDAMAESGIKLFCTENLAQQ